MTTPGVKYQDEQDFPLPIQDAVSLIPYKKGGIVTLDSADPFEIVHVSDLRRFENSDSIDVGTVSNVNATSNTFNTSTSDLIRLGIQSGDHITNSTSIFTTAILSIVGNTVEVEDGSIWADGNFYQIDKRSSHQSARAEIIRKLSLIVDGECYIRFDGLVDTTNFDVHLNSDEGYFTDMIRVATRITAVRVGSTDVQVRYTVWGL